MASYRQLISEMQTGMIYAMCREENHKFMIRGFRRYDDHTIEWEILEPHQSPLNVGYFFDLSEEELFQLSCTFRHNVYELRGLMLYMREQYDTIEDKPTHIRSTVELEF